MRTRTLPEVAAALRPRTSHLPLFGLAGLTAVGFLLRSYVLRSQALVLTGYGELHAVELTTCSFVIRGRAPARSSWTAPAVSSSSALHS